jgi:hypothetical protein
LLRVIKHGAYNYGIALFQWYFTCIGDCAYNRRVLDTARHGMNATLIATVLKNIFGKEKIEDFEKKAQALLPMLQDAKIKVDSFDQRLARIEARLDFIGQPSPHAHLRVSNGTDKSIDVVT